MQQLLVNYLPFLALVTKSVTAVIYVFLKRASVQVMLHRWLTLNSLTVTRPSAFVPDTPLGVTWPGTEAVRIDWRGRQ
jgi:fatty-acid desaturase